MGQVFEALDLELGENIAIKAIRPQIADSPGTIARFKREVYATRKITHPNVCRTFDLECHTPPGARPDEPRDSIIFLTMELLHGETLAQRIERDGPLPPGQVYVLAVQVAGALGAAHEAGVIHCDLKPANIFLTGSESKLRAVVTDFGIARVNPLYDQTRITGNTEAATRTGEIIGTPDYMAPEQFRTRQCTPATDIYSFGLILYESLTGLRGFTDSPSEENIRNRLATATRAATGERAAIPKEWSFLLSRCLQIDPENRFRHVEEVLDVLASMPAPRGRIATAGSRRTLPFKGTARFPSRGIGRRGWLARNARLLAGAALAAVVLAAGYMLYARFRSSAEGAVDTPTVAVLPIAGPEKDTQDGALAESLAEDLTNDLAQVSGIRVASEEVVRNVGHPLDVRTAGQELKVGAVVSGSLRRTADGMRLVLNLVDVQTGAQIWGQIYNCKPKGCSALDPDIAQELAFRLELKEEASHPRKARREHSQNPSAEAAYQKGEQAMAEHTPASFAQAIDDFQQAVDADPEDAPAMAELAYDYDLMAYNYNRPEAPVSLMNETEQTARRALQLDSTSAEAYSALAGVEVLKDFNWTAAEKDFRRAIELDPAYLPAHTSYALNVLTPLGRFAEARAQSDYVDRAPGKPPGAIVSAALDDYFAGSYPASLERLQAARTLLPSSWLIVEAIADDYLAMNQPDKAQALLTETAAPTDDDRLIQSVSLGIFNARTGHRQQALAELEKSEKLGDIRLNYHLATLLVALGYNDKALDYLDRAVAARESDILFLRVDPLLIPLRTNPRFQVLATKLNLVEDKENAL